MTDAKELTPAEWLTGEISDAARAAAARDAATADRLELALAERARLAPARTGWLGAEIGRRGGDPFAADEVL